MSDPADRTAPLPVTVIGGYLGSGKTTMVNHLLTHDQAFQPYRCWMQCLGKLLFHALDSQDVARNFLLVIL